MGYLECEECKGRYELKKGESPDDFESCECGGKLKHITPNIAPIKKSGINFTTKILIVVIIVLVLAVGIAAGMIMTNKEPVANNTTNNTTVTVNNSGNNPSTTTTTTKTTETSDKNDKVMISAKEAQQIATKTLSGYEVRGTGASLSQGNGHPIWIVYLENPDGSKAGQCAVDATTGKFLG